jgi:hypothetical protein
MMKAKAMMKVLDELLLPTGLSVPKLTNINITTIITMRIITITIQLTLPR